MNRLKNEQSPYLLMHADNPVDWYAWSDEAFHKAREENKPIFLSIGYSTCHWCHVMEAESFKDREVARLLNETFVPVKVDREERPDIDSIYMSVCIIFTGSGGWPLTILMTPDKEPFYAATYIPKESRYGMPGLIDLIHTVKAVWEKDHDDIKIKAKEDALAVRFMHTNEPGTGEVKDDIVHSLYTDLTRLFDSDYGGFGTRPKFPSTPNLFFLLRYWYYTKENNALDMVEKQLKKMRSGGIYDHIGYGFHRYTTDREWKEPHFEKMLYDQALLALVYTETYQATGKELYKKAAVEICTYVLKNMQTPCGGFYSAEDADSEGVEGKYYLWTLEELSSLLTEEELDLFLKVYPVKPEGNVKEENPGMKVIYTNAPESTGRKNGLNIIYREKEIKEIAGIMQKPVTEISAQLGKIKARLEKERKKRIPPLKDTKILTDWNGLMIAALAKAAQVFDMPLYADAAAKAADFILTTMLDEKKGLLHRYRNNVKGIDAFADDYAFFTWGLIELYETTFSPFYLEKSVELTDYFISQFWDKEAGGFFMSAHNSDELIVRKKEYTDRSLPSANSIAFYNLTRLSRMTRNDSYERYNQILKKSAFHAIEKAPSAYAFYLGVYLSFEQPGTEIVIVGDELSPDTELFLTCLRSVYIPGKVVILKTDSNKKQFEKTYPFLCEYKKKNSKATAYVCQSFSCNKPTNDPAEMLKQLVG